MTYPPLASRLHGKMHRPLSLSMTRVVISAGAAVDPTLDAGGKPLMFISHDYSSAATPTGTDWDDLQDACIERLLMNQFKIVSGCTMSGANGANGIDNTENLRVSAAYAADYTAHSLASLGYPTPDEEAALMTLTGSTTLANASTGRSSASNPFIEKCIAIADANPTPYYILVTSGGGETDFLEMFLRRPDLQPRCVFRRGSPFSPNTNYGIDPNAADYVDAQAQAGGTLANLAAVIDDQTSHRGIYITAAGANTLYDSPASPLWHQLKTRIHGSLGRLLFEYSEEIGNGPGMKNGDFPGVLYAFDQTGAVRTNSDLIDGTLQSLGGKFQAHATIAKRFIDIPTGQTLGIYPGAATVRNKGATVGGGQDFIYNTFMLNRLAQLGTQTQVRVNGAISGSARVGATLTVSAITWIGGTPDVIEYQWAWGPANSPTAIVGATSAGYSPVTGDIGHTLVRGVRGKLTSEDFGDWAYTAATATIAAASNMPVPQSSGTAVSATAANAQVNVTAPASLADGDLEHLIIRTANQPISTPSGWSSRASVGTGTAAAVGSVALQLFERVANVTGGDSADVVITGTYDNLSARRLRYTGQGASSPTTDIQTKIVSTASTSVSSPTGTTPQANCLARAYIGYGLDATSAGATLANSSLANVSSTGNWGTTVGVGGVTNTAVGEKAAAGAVSAWTATCTSAKQVHIVCVIQP